MKLLITGGAGFIGSNLVLFWRKHHPDDELLNIDNLTYAADPKYLSSVRTDSKYRFLQADIADRNAVKKFVVDFSPDAVLHLAAETHVDASIADPEKFVSSNVVGTFNLLEECRLLWKKNSSMLASKRFHHVSTDEVFGSLGAKERFSETTAYAPSSPYSASKAASDHLVRAYHTTYGLNTVITNCSNNFGPHQHAEKFIPTIIRSCLSGSPIPVYGKGENVRDWLFVEDHCQALDIVFHKGKSGESYNIGSGNEWKNIDLVRKVCELMNETVGAGPEGDYKNLLSFVTDRPGHDYRYAIDSSKIERELGWKASGSFDEQLRSTVKWYVEKFSG